MRSLILIVFALFASPAFAQDWARYDNARYGYGMAIPPGFVGEGESLNGDGQRFYSEAGGRALLVWGGNLLDDFEGEVATAVAEDGLSITYQAATPRWASFSGMAGGQIIYQRMVLLCDGESYAAFRAAYGQRDRDEMDQIVEAMVQSLKGNGC